MFFRFYYYYIIYKPASYTGSDTSLSRSNPILLDLWKDTTIIMILTTETVSALLFPFKVANISTSTGQICHSTFTECNSV